MFSIEDIWERITEEFEYFISFEWISDMGESFMSLFENLSELSPIGTIYGIIMVGLVFLLRKFIFNFVNSLGIVSQIIWYPVFYTFAFGIGYIMGRKVWN
ncbi:MAG TPA: hypothetical protein ENI61_04075 [Ignavibacteria bacterium]|nr:hypothetical protein [Ignavibacteria bacterium]